MSKRLFCLNKKAVILLFVFVFSIVGFVISTNGAQASVKKELAFTENFYSDKISDRWVLKDVDYRNEFGALHFTPTSIYGSATVLNKYQLADYNKFVFDINVEKFESTSYIHMYLGGKTPTVSTTTYDTRIAFRDKTISVASNNGNKEYNQNTKTYTLMQGSSAISAFTMGNRRSTITIVIRKTDSERNLHEIVVTYAADGATYYTATFNDYLIEGKYIAFDNSSNISWNLIDFKVKNASDEVVFKDDFSEDTVTEPSQAYENGNWHIIGSFSKKDIFVCSVAYLLHSKENGMAICNVPIVNDGKTKVVSEISFNILLELLRENVAVGMAFGLSEPSPSAKTSGFVGIRKKSATQAEFVCVKEDNNGKVVSAEGSIPLTLFPESDYATLTYRCLYDNSVEIQIDKYSARFDEIEVAGYWSIGQLSLANNALSYFRVDDITMYKSRTVNYSGKDVSNNFAGIKEVDGDEEYYINRQRYYLGPKVSLAQKGIFVTEPYIQFANSTAFSCFGYWEKYDEFICEFDFINKSKVQYQSFGLSFAKKTAGTRLSGEFNPSVGFLYTGSATNIITYGCKTSEGKVEAPINGYNFFADTETKYNFMFIVRNRTVEIYYKKDSEPISELGKLRAKVVDVDTDGYVTIFGNASATFQIFNFKLTNLNENCKEQSNLAIREDFNDNTFDNKLTVNAIVENGLAKLGSNSVIKMNKADTFYLMRMSVKQFSDIAIEFSNDKKLVINSSGTISVTENSTTVEIESLNRAVDFTGNKLKKFDIRIQGSTLTIGYITQDDVTEMLYELLATYTFTSEPEQGILSIKSGSSAEIDELHIFSLSDLYEAEPTNYIGNEDNASPWVKKPVKKTPKNCSSSIDPAFAIMTIALLFAAVSIANKKMRGGER